MFALLLAIAAASSSKVPPPPPASDEGGIYMFETGTSLLAKCRNKAP